MPDSSRSVRAICSSVFACSADGCATTSSRSLSTNLFASLTRPKSVAIAEPVLKSSSIAFVKPLAQFGELLQRRIVARIERAGGSRGGRIELVITLPGDTLEPFEELIKRVDAAGRFGQQLFAVLDRAAIVRREQEEANRLGGVPLEQFGERLALRPIC